MNTGNVYQPFLELRRRQLKVKYRQANNESQITGLKCNKECTHGFFRDVNKSTKERLVFLKTSKREERHASFLSRET